MSQTTQKSRFEFTADNLCLDFTNTVNNRAGERPEELLKSYDALLQWSIEAGVLTAKLADRMRTLAKEAPGRAQSVTREAVQLRDAIFHIFMAVAEHRVVPDTALSYLNRALQHVARHSRLVQERRRFVWEWVDIEENLDSMLWPVIRSAADLLVSDKIDLVGQCASMDCGWLFLDTTKNHRRRWCDMKGCGNRDKARRYYRRTKAQ
jgi:predicted RNA-binding Zn ribbon-like protein